VWSLRGVGDGQAPMLDNLHRTPTIATTLQPVPGLVAVGARAVIGVLSAATAHTVGDQCYSNPVVHAAEEHPTRTHASLEAREVRARAAEARALAAEARARQQKLELWQRVPLRLVSLHRRENRQASLRILYL